MKIYYVMGFARAGKNTFINAVLSQPGVKGGTISTVDTIKAVATMCFGWNNVKDEKGRRLLVDLRSAWGRYNEGPINEIYEYVAALKEEGHNVCFVQVREYPEMMKMKKQIGGESLFIERTCDIILPCERVFGEMIPKDYTYDIPVYNHETLEDLNTIAKHFARQRIVGA